MTKRVGSLARCIACFSFGLAVGSLGVPSPMSALSQATSITAGQDRFVDSGGVRIRFIERGTGDPIVLLHGIGGGVQTWIDSGVFHELAVDHRVIAFDARGHAKSDKPHDPKQYGRQMALDVVRLLDHLSITRAHIVGYSMGAAITAQLLMLHPERFITATLGGGGGRLRWTAEDAKLAEQEAVEREKECVSRTLIYRLAPVSGPKPSEIEIKARSDACFADPTQDRFALAALTRARGDQAINAAQFAAVTVPTLGIAGTADPLLAGLKELKQVRPALQLVTIEGATHAGPRGAMAQPEFVAGIRRFIAAHSRVSRGLAWSAYVKEKYAANHQTLIVPSCGHNERCMFTADVALPVLFPKR